MKNRPAFSRQPSRLPKQAAATFHHEQAHGFTCVNCQHQVAVSPHMGTANRNHCPNCLWSRHVDIVPGDRQAACHGAMQPIALTFKAIGDKTKRGEIMLVHRCLSCAHISINRMAGDDSEPSLIAAYETSLISLSDEDRQVLRNAGISTATENDRSEISLQLFGSTT